MSGELINKILAKVVKKMGGGAPAPLAAPAPMPVAGALPAMAEFVGTNALGDTIGMVITNIDPKLRTMIRLEKDSRSIGILGIYTGANPHIFAAGEAVRATNPEVLTIELPRDTKGDAGRGSLIIFGTEDVSDIRRAVEMALDKLDRTFGGVYGNDTGRLELQYTARVSYALNKVFGAPIGKAFGIIIGAPAGIDVVLADTVVKVVAVDVIGYANPAGGTSHSNGVTSPLDGDSDAVRQAIIAAREMGIPLLGTLGIKPGFIMTPYI